MAAAICEVHSASGTGGIETVSQLKVKGRTKRLTADVREDQIVQAAARLFREKGYHGTSMRDIADVVGVHKGSLYQHISSKEDLLFHIVSGGLDLELRGLEEVYALPLPPAEKMRQAIRNHITYTEMGRDRVGVFLEDTKHLSTPKRKVLAGQQKRYEEIFKNILQEGIDAGQFQPCDVKIVSFAILGMCNWIYRWYDKRGRVTPEELARIFSQFVFKGLGLETLEASQ